jgi:transcriptional regulator with XRE-family HTH domain
MRGATSKKQSAPRPEYGRGTGVPNPIDVEVGGRIRTRRLLLGMNQQALAEALDLTFQQVQKYEHGANRVSASRLAAVAKILAVPISYFFADLQSDGAELSVEDKKWREQLQRPETIELIRLYYAIVNPEIRRQFLEIKVGGGGRRLEPRAGPMRPSVRGQTGWRGITAFSSA